MKKQAIIFVVITVLALISCTGCDSEIGGSVDLSYDTGTLTSFQWEKELLKDDIEYISFNAIPFREDDDTLFMLNIFDNEELNGEPIMGIVNLASGSSIIATIDGVDYQLRITSNSEGVLTLSLKDQDDKVMYFAATPLEL